MSDWMTAQEIAEAGLMGMPRSKYGVLKVAYREGWNDHPTFCRERSGRGGGREYNVRLLPAMANIDRLQRSMTIGKGKSDEQPDLLDRNRTRFPADGSPKALLERDARLAIVAAYERFAKGLALGRASTVQIFADKYATGAIEVENWVRDIVPSFSTRTLMRWRSAKRHGQSLAVDRAAARKGKGVLDQAGGGDVKAFVLGLIAHQPHLSAAHVRDQVRAAFGDRLTVVQKGVEKAVNVPPVRTFQHFLKTLKADNAVTLTKLTNPDAFRSHMKLAGTGTLRHITRPNALWQIDESPVDALCTDGRYSVYVCIDIATRRTILTLSKTPKAEAVGLLIRKAVLEWGLPAEIKIDNGSDFKSKAMSRVFAALGIEVSFSDAYSPEQKGFVERVIKTFQHDAVTLVPGFVGHNVTDRKAIESRKSFAQRLGEDDAATFAVQCSATEMQVFFDDWANLHYQHRPHAGLKGKTPFETASEAAHTVRTVDERALDMLLAPMPDGNGFRTVTKFGVRVQNFHYLNGEILPGTRVFVRLDPDNKGLIYLFEAEDGGYLGQAVCAELAGIPPKAFVKAEKEKQAELLRSASAEIDRQRRQFRKGPALIERAREVWLRDVPNVTALPRPQVAQQTPDISAALDAAERPHRAPTSGGLTGRAAEIHAELLAATEPADMPAVAPAAKVTRLETQQTRYRRALDIEASIDAGEDCSHEDLLWLGGYREGPEYKAMRAMQEDFGDSFKV